MVPEQLYLGPLSDNRRWDHVHLRADDVIVVTPPKSGTTWMQTILALLLSGDPDVAPDVSVNMPWLDNRLREIAPLAERLEAMTGRRSMKSHTPLDGLPLRQGALYVCVFRHPLDAHFSFRKHVRNMPLTWFDHWYPQEDPDGIAMRRFLDGGPEGFDMDAMPLAHILRHYAAARAALAGAAQAPAGAGARVALFHYADMTRDLPGTFARLAGLLGVSHPAPLMARLVEAARFEAMKRQADRYAPSGGMGFWTSDQDFFDSGSSGKWHGVLNAAEIAAYDAMMDAHLEPDARVWLEYGDRGAA